MSLDSSNPREQSLADFRADIHNILAEKLSLHGERGGFYETNAEGDYTHAIGEAKIKLNEYLKTGNLRNLIKAAGWIYLIYETEMQK